MFTSLNLKNKGPNLYGFMFLRFFPRGAIAVRIRKYSYTAERNSPFDLLHFLKLSSNHRSLQLTRQSHSRMVAFGLTQNPFLATKLVSAYATTGGGGGGQRTESRLVFDSVPEKSMFLWNSLINGYVKNCMYDCGLRVLEEMCNGCGISPDDFTLATVSKACAELGDLKAGRLVHGKSMQLGFVSDVVVANSLMVMYSNCGVFIEARKMFDEMPKRNVGSWNVLISGYANSRSCSFDKVLWEMVSQMQFESVKPDGFTVSSLLPLCNGDAGKWDYGRELHCYAVKNGLDSGLSSDVHLDCCLIDMYSKRKRVVIGRRVFDRVKCKNVYVWTAMINGYVHNEIFEEALILFCEMQAGDGIKPNKVSLISVLPACSSFTGLLAGKQVHGFIIRKELTTDTSLCNALIDTYVKCGSLASARQIFEDGLFLKDEISWSTMISGYGLHGMAKEAIALFYEMLKLGNKPDMVTIVGVLSACGRSGLSKEGLAIYKLVSNRHGVSPTPEICSCVVDILGRSGRLDEALDFVRKMPVEAGPSVWGALVSASVLHGNLEMQELAYRFLLELEPENPSNYVSLSNLHASSKRWDAVAKLRTTMKQRGIKKTPGCSWISVDGKTHCFLVSDKAHPSLDWIHEMLDNLVLMMIGTGCSHYSENLADC